MVILFITAIIAMILSNSPIKHEYLHFIHHNVTIGFLKKPFEMWVNEGLMAIFFFHIGLEMKKEFGNMPDVKKIITPAIAAIGGMVVPAICYLLIAGKSYIAGWAIPTATDIAFSLGICGLLGKKIPNEFRMLLMSIAIFDDLGAVIMIAVFYSDNLSLSALISSSLIIAGIVFIKSLTDRIAFYLALGLLLWLAVVKSGVHATLAGFILAILLPEHKVAKIEHLIHPWVMFLIMPLFALVNAGVDLSSVDLNTIQHPITIGIVLGLALGKPLGIMLAMQITKILGWQKAWSNAETLALGALCGVGFTMSLFIGKLAFTTEFNINCVKLGVMLGSILMGMLGYVILKISYNKSIHQST